MPVLQTDNPEIIYMEGVHLFHFALSSCSQRVRFALEEKQVDWQSHHIDLNKLENVSERYQSIHPKGYVPALVHASQLITESTDIISYIDRIFPGVSLQPRTETGQAAIAHWLDLANGNQWCLKHLTYELRFKPRGHFSRQEDLDYYVAHQKNTELVQFTKDFFAGFSKELIEDKLQEAYGFLEELDRALATTEYLGGQSFSLADIACIVNVHRYRLCELDMERFPSLLRWYALIESRPGFERAIKKRELH